MVAIYLEVGKKKIGACSLEWPGWCRFAKTEDEAIQALYDSAPRYCKIVDRAGLKFDLDDPVVVERVQGDTTTDFGAPSSIASVDTGPVDGETARRNVALLRAAWEIMDEVLAVSSSDLRKGPRGGGRDRDEIARHVIEAERAYARKIGVRHKPFASNDRAALANLRNELTDVLSKPSDGALLVPGGWPPSYAIRRIAWHVIDHIWEIEDRQI